MYFVTNLLANFNFNLNLYYAINVLLAYYRNNVNLELRIF